MSGSNCTFPAKKKDKTDNDKINRTAHLLVSNRIDAIISIHDLFTCCTLFWLPIKCGKKISEQIAAPIKLKPANNPRSFSISEAANCKAKNPATVVKLPIVKGEARSLIVCAILLVCRLWLKICSE